MKESITKSSVQIQLNSAAVKAFQKKKYADSLELFNELIDENTDNENYPEQKAEWFYNRSFAKEALDDRRGAISDIIKSVKLLDIQLAKIHQAYFRLAILQLQTDEEQEALKNLVKAYELGSANAEEILRGYTNFFPNKKEG